MSAATKSIVFLAITFVISWSVTIVGWRMGAAETPIAAFLTLTCMMTGPAIAALICAILFEKGRRVEALGLSFKPNVWWLIAYIAPLLLCALSVVAAVLLSGRALGDLNANILTEVVNAGQDPEALRGIPLVPLVLAQALLFGALTNAVALTFTEELGWRGYLYGLWRPFGFWRTSLATGAIWGVWHAPAIYFFGLNYPTERLLGIGLFIVFCTLLSPLITLIRDRGGSTWAAGIFHGTFNAAAGLTLLSLADASFPWNGIVGIGGYIALALGVAATALLQRSKAA